MSINQHKQQQQQLLQQQQQQQPLNVLPHWPDTFPSTSMAQTVTNDLQISMSAPLIDSNPIELTNCASSDEQQLQQQQHSLLQQQQHSQLQQQQQQQQQSTSNSVVTNNAPMSKRKVVPSVTIPCQTAPLEMSNNSTKKLNEPVEMCKECSMVFPTGLDLKKHIDLAHQVNISSLQHCIPCSFYFILVV